MVTIGEKLHVRVHGRGPAVLLLHGAPCPADHFAPLVADLERDHRVLVPELPGYGRSPALPSGWTLDAAHELVETALLELGVREVATVGFSLGAYRALALACRGGVAVRSIVSLAGFASLPDEERAGMRGFADALRSGADLRDALVSRMLAEAFAATHPAAVTAVQEWMSCVSPDVLADELVAMAEVADLRPKLPSLRVKAVARVGALDAATPTAHSREIASLLPGCRLEIVPSAGHALLVEDLLATVASVRRALTEG